MQQLIFEAKDSTEFRALLGRILESSTLSCGQIAIKAGMPRSTAYSLPGTKRLGLPSNPEQIRDFVRACGLSVTQIELVMHLWLKLQNETEEEAAAGDGILPGLVVGAVQSGKSRIATDAMLAWHELRGVRVDHHQFGVSPPRLRETSGIDLLQ
ncbi:hypothetical protein [Amycolatopsis sp. cmx-4-54]|uniref:hypothetical protein n=1 Tax=Amycolatopsis sp. cmx-4-54 TaxID=2790936 RepID=UPI00397908C5